MEQPKYYLNDLNVEIQVTDEGVKITKIILP